MTTPLLSFIVGGRNDTYMGDFPWRLSTCLNYLAQSLSSINRLNSVEMVVCDWGSEVPVSEVLDLTPHAKALCRFVIVPPAIASAAQKDSPFPIPIVQNVAIRRARGEFIAQTDSDIIFPALTLERLLAILERKIDLGLALNQALLVCSRRHIPFEFALAQPSLSEVENYLRHYGPMLPYDHLIPGFATPSGLALLHRSLWEKCQGYDEKLIYWGWMEIDLYLRLTQRYPWFDLDGQGVNLYHIEHYTNRKAQPRKSNPMLVSTEFTANDQNWGMKDLALEERSLSSQHRGREPWGDPAWCASILRMRSVQQLTVESISSELFNRDLVVQTVQLLLSYQELLTQTPQLLQLLARYEDMFSGKIAVSWDFRTALVWYANKFRPLAFLDTSIGFTDAAPLVASQFRPVSIFGMGTWSTDAPTRMINRPGELSDILSKKLNHAGYVQYISGNTTVKQLETVVGPPKSFDLVCFSHTFEPSSAVEDFISIVPRISLGGCLVVTNFAQAYLERIKSLPAAAKELDQFVCCQGVDSLVLLKRG